MKEGKKSKKQILHVNHSWTRLRKSGSYLLKKIPQKTSGPKSLLSIQYLNLRSPETTYHTLPSGQKSQQLPENERGGGLPYVGSQSNKSTFSVSKSQSTEAPRSSKHKKLLVSSSHAVEGIGKAKLIHGLPSALSPSPLPPPKKKERKKQRRSTNAGIEPHQEGVKNGSHIKQAANIPSKHLPDFPGSSMLFFFFFFWKNIVAVVVAAATAVLHMEKVESLITKKGGG